MAATRIHISSVAACLLIAGCAAPPGVDLNAEALNIRELDRQWLAAFQEKDMEGAVRFFARDAVLMPAHTPAIVGREQILAWFESWLQNPTVSSTFAPDVVEVAASGDLAYDRGTYHFTSDTAEGRVADSGKYLIVWKMIDGEWKAIFDISNSDLASPELSPLEDSTVDEQ